MPRTRLANALEAVAAVDRPIVLRNEGHLGGSAALRANRVVHLTRRAAAAAAITLALTGIAARLAAHGLVGEAGGQPDGGRSQALDVVEPVAQSFQITALVEALVGGIEPGGQAVAGEATGVVGGVAVREPVGHDEVELLLGAGLTHRLRDQGVVVRRVALAEAGRLHADALEVVVEREAQGRGAGDRERDVTAGEAAGVKGILINSDQPISDVLHLID